METVNRLTTENGGIVTLMQEANRAGGGALAQVPVLKRQFDVGQQRVKELLEQHDKLNQELLDEQFRLMTVCNGAVAELNELLIPLLASARAELGLPFDSVAFARLVRDAQKKATLDLEGFMDEIRTIV